MRSHDTLRHGGTQVDMALGVYCRLTWFSVVFLAASTSSAIAKERPGHGKSESEKSEGAKSKQASEAGKSDREKSNTRMRMDDVSKKPFLMPTVLKVGQPVLFEDGLRIELQSFSHKRPRVGGPTMATAYLQLHPVKGDAREVRLSVHGREGQEGRTFERERFSREYEFTLTAFSYDESIELTVRRWDVKAEAYGHDFTLPPDELIMFEGGLKLRFRAAAMTLEVITDELGGHLDTVHLANLLAGGPSLDGGQKGSSSVRYGRDRIHVLSVESNGLVMRVERES
ncbi:MAG: hypothetical protein IPK13_17085 [Deltaproteobacteria bacterium]|nr:hypothetical protein [Deltaproteobacteria bacterium]